MTTTKARGWCFTLNNYTEDDVTRLQQPNEAVAYICFGKEIAPSTGTPHLQGYVFLCNPRGMSGVKKLIGKTAHIAYANGTPDDNIKYCSKEGDFYERGDRPQQGKRTDLVEIRNKILKGESNLYEIALTVSSYQGLRMAEGLSKYVKAPAQCVKEVHWYYGPTGTGKSKLAFELAGEDYWVSGKDGRWYDGYWGQKVAIFDDFRGDFCPLHTLLRLTDRYPYRVEVKGGSLWFSPKTIIITSTYSPYECYSQVPESIQQLMRRITVLKEFQHNQVITRKQPDGNEVPSSLLPQIP